MTNEVIEGMESILTLLNTVGAPLIFGTTGLTFPIEFSSGEYIKDPYLGNRYRNLFVNQDFVLSSSKYLPLCQIRIEDVDGITGFGDSPKRYKNATYTIFFYTKKGFYGSGNSEGLKDKKLIRYFLERIRDVISYYHSDIKYLRKPQFGSETGINYIPNLQAYWGAFPVTFQIVKR